MIFFTATFGRRGVHDDITFFSLDKGELVRRVKADLPDSPGSYWKSFRIEQGYGKNYEVLILKHEIEGTPENIIAMLDDNGTAGWCHANRVERAKRSNGIIVERIPVKLQSATWDRKANG